jgi:4-carboxymuconolactone decarboxylase
MRLSPLDELSPEQVELLKSTRKRGPDEGPLPEPFRVWARDPGLAYWVEGLGHYCRTENKHSQRLRELSVLIAGRHFDSPSAWNAHYQQAIELGVSADALARLARGEDPQFEAEDERVFYAFAHEMLHDHYVSPSTWDAAIGLFGEDGVLDLIGCIGSFSMSAMMLNAVQLVLNPHLGDPFPDMRGFQHVTEAQERA